jgi:hypothetical protein
MTWPPALMHIKVKNETHDIGLWLPIFLLWPLALAVVIILLPIILLGLIIFWDSWGMWSLKVLWAAIAACCSLRGLEVDVQTGKDLVYITMI